MWTLKVYILRVRLDNVSSHITGDIQDALVVLDGVLVVDGGVSKLVFVCIVALLELNDALHQRMVQVERDLWMVCIIISHNLILAPPRPSPRGGSRK